MALSTGNVPGPATGKVLTMALWDPDGAGPAAERLVLGGDFTFPGLRASHLASFDLATGSWSSLGGGASHPVRDLVVLPDGDLLAVGGFLTIGGVQAFCVARCDGSAWHALGGGLPGGGNVVAVAPNGDPVVGCWSTPGQPNLVRWNGTHWTEFAGPVDEAVQSLAFAPNGDLYVGGAFVFAGSTFLSRIGRWDGAAWHPLGAGVQGTVHHLVLRPNGELIAAGLFSAAGGSTASSIARWNGATWAPLGAGSAAAVTMLTVLPGGDVLAGGEFQPISGPATNLARWDGAGWHAIEGRCGGPTQFPYAAVVRADGELFVGGNFDLCGNVVGAKVVRRGGSGWQPLGDGPDDRVQAVAFDAAGAMHVGGPFEVAGGAFRSRLAYVPGGVWQVPPFVPSSLVQYYGPVTAFLRLADGRLAATSFGGYTDRTIALWNGQHWAPLAATVNHDVLAIAETAAGEILVGGSFLQGGSKVARYTGSAFVPVGDLRSGSVGVHALLAMPDRRVFAAGNLLTSPVTWQQPFGHVATWDGTRWQQVGAGLFASYGDTVRCLVALPNGDVVAAGSFVAAGIAHLARWDGSTWSPLGTGVAGGLAATGVHAALVTPDGSLLVGGDFTSAGGVPAHGLARWDGSSWSAVDPGVEGVVRTMAWTPDGDLMVGGDFAQSGGVASGHLVRVRSACRPGAASFGSGCVGAAGPLALTADVLPWLGGSYRATCQAVPSGAFAFGLRGFAPTAVPLRAYLPQAGAGCMQWVGEDSVVWLPEVGGRATTSLTIPVAPWLLGTQLFEQVVVAELSPASAILGLTSSNALRLTIGRF